MTTKCSWYCMWMDAFASRGKRGGSAETTRSCRWGSRDVRITISRGVEIVKIIMSGEIKSSLFTASQNSTPNSNLRPNTRSNGRSNPEPTTDERNPQYRVKEVEQPR